MGTTPVFGFPYPDPSDLVANYPALGQQLAEDVEAEFLLRGKILQIIRATDATDRSTTSTSFVDVTGVSVTITPQKNDSAVLIIANVNNYSLYNSGSSAAVPMRLQITDSANVAISGAESGLTGADNYNYSGNSAVYDVTTMIAYATPATTSAVTYKLRFRSGSAAATAFCFNSVKTAQIYAIEVAA